MEQQINNQPMVTSPTPTTPTTLQGITDPKTPGTGAGSVTGTGQSKLVASSATKTSTTTTPKTATATSTSTTKKKRPTVAVIDDPLSLNHVLFDLIDLYSYMYLHEPNFTRLEQLQVNIIYVAGKFKC